MVNVESLIVEGKCFLLANTDSASLNMLKYSVKAIMLKKGYLETSMSMFKDNFLEMNFLIFQKPIDLPLHLRIMDKLNLLSEEKKGDENYFRNFKIKRNDSPFRVNLCIVPQKIKSRHGFIINIRSEPVKLFKIRQLGFKPRVEDFEYSNIIETNKQFIKEVMLGLGAKIIEKPSAISEYKKTLLEERLDKIGFKKSSELIKNCSIKIERGDVEDGLTDLRSALEIFIKDAVEKTGGTPYKQDEIKRNLQIMCDNGFLNEVTVKIAKNISSIIYSYLSEASVHKREKLRKADAKFLFSLTESIIDYIIIRVVFRE